METNISPLVNIKYANNCHPIFTINPDSVNIDIINLPRSKTVKEIVVDKNFNNDEDDFLGVNN